MTRQSVGQHFELLRVDLGLVDAVGDAVVDLVENPRDASLDLRVCLLYTSDAADE